MSVYRLKDVLNYLDGSGLIITDLDLIEKSLSELYLSLESTLEE